jgi:HNH endonuclease
MSQQRRNLAANLVRAIGSSTARVVDLRNGWPARIEVRNDQVWMPVDLYISTISSHARAAYEFRFQNPAEENQRPIIPVAGVLPVLIGFTEDWGKPICVAPDVTRRIGSRNRFSILFRDSLIQQAVNRGWAEYNSSTDETIVAFQAALLPAYLSLRSVGANVPIIGITNTIENTGFNEVEDETVRQRARVAVSRLARDWAFRRDVVSAYEGHCALCGLDWGLIEAAHIYPASAPNSPDTVPNGLGLCGNHHILLDSHKLHVDPQTFRVKIHPAIRANANSPGRLFLDNTFTELKLPTNRLHRPSSEMLTRR